MRRQKSTEDYERQGYQNRPSSSRQIRQPAQRQPLPHGDQTRQTGMPTQRYSRSEGFGAIAKAGGNHQAYRPQRAPGPIWIETNHFELTIKKIKSVIHYDVAIDPNKPKCRLRSVMEEFRQRHYPKRHPAFDGAKNMYASSYLPFNDEISGEVIIKDNGRDLKFKVHIKLAAVLDFTRLQPQAPYAIKQGIIQCLDVVLRNAPSSHYKSAGRSFFSNSYHDQVDLGKGLTLYNGFFQSAILGERLFLNVDVTHKAFTKNIAVVDLMNEMNKDFILVNTFLKDLKVQYEIPGHPSSKRTMTVHELRGPPAKKEHFRNDTNNEKMTVVEYFQRFKNVKLKHPDLPCLWVNSQRSQTIFLPPEFCTIIEGQNSKFPMTDYQTTKMINATASSTYDRKCKIMNFLTTSNLRNDYCVNEFGIEVSKHFTKIQAQVLEPPCLKYKKQIKRPQGGVWSTGEFNSIGNLKIWSIICVDEFVKLQELHCFAEKMMRQGRDLGMNISDPNITRPIKLTLHSERQTLEKIFSTCKTHDLVMVVIPDNPKNIYNFVKQAAELNVGVLTQCIKSVNVQRAQPATIGNILLKVNAKLNGTNQCLSVTPASLDGYCMIMGADVTHPRRENRSDVPSVAAVTASCDVKAFKYKSICRLQDPTVEIITNLAEMVYELLKSYAKAVGNKPQRIIFFRDGVSDGEFEKVVKIEVQAIRSAYKLMEPNGSYKPKLTFLVVQKRHHTRFFPTDKNDADKNRNVPPGTIVDTVITNKDRLEFYLLSHTSIRGVGRPTRYRLLWDDNNMQPEEIQKLTYYLCHMYCRCTRSVSYPAPTYYAHNAAARAKVHLAGKTIDMNNLDREQSLLQVKPEVSDTSVMYYM